MKKLFFLFLLTLSVCTVQADAPSEDETTTIVTEVKKNKHGTYDVTTTTTVDGKITKIIPDSDVKEEDLGSTIVGHMSTSEATLSGSKNVMAGPDGEGDYKGGRMPKTGPGDFPPIVIIVGDDKGKMPKLPKNSFIMNYKSMEDMQRNYKGDLAQAIDQVIR